VAVTAEAAARRAPGLKAAAEALHQLCATSHPSAGAIPVEVRAEAERWAVASTDAALCARVGAWLLKAPYELKKGRTPLAAIAAAAPVAAVSVQDPGVPCDPDLKAVCEGWVRAAQKRHRAEVRAHRLRRRLDAPLGASHPSSARKRGRDRCGHMPLPARHR
jgi:hypothetical protein